MIGARQFLSTVESRGKASYAHHVSNRSDFQNIFRELVATDPNSRGVVLDVGCSGAMNPAVQAIYERASVVHGVDPSPDVLANAALAEDGRWHGQLESATLPPHRYDMAIAYNVAEHVRTPLAFLEALHRVLKPGGTAWVLTPNGSHPFALLSRTLEVVGLKPFFAKHDAGVNEYPAYYRLNTCRAIERHAAVAGFAATRFVYVPCMQWDRYFPAFLRWGPRFYDRLIGLRVPARMQILIFQLHTSPTTLPEGSRQGGRP